MLKDLSDEERRLLSEFFQQRSLVIIKKESLEWIDKQIAIGKYKNHCDAIEDLIHREIKSLNNDGNAAIDEKECGADMNNYEEIDYRIIKLPRDLTELIDSLIGRWGYRTRTEFVKDACRRLLREYGINPKVEGVVEGSK